MIQVTFYMEITLTEPFLSTHPDGVIISLRISTKSSKIGPLGVIGTSLKWGVNAAPVDGQANQALIEDLAKRLHCAKSKISIYRGATSKNKLILISGAKIDEIKF